MGGFLSWNKLERAESPYDNVSVFLLIQFQPVAPLL